MTRDVTRRPDARPRWRVAIARLLLRFVPALHHPDVRRTVRNAAFSSADYLLLPVLWLATTPIFVGRLGMETYGIWMLANSILGLGSLTSMGMTDATIKFVAKYRARGDLAAVAAVLRCSMTLYVVLGLVAGLFVFAVAPLLADHAFRIGPAGRSVAVTAFRLVGLGVASRFVESIFLSGIQGFERHDFAARVRIVTTASAMAINVALVCRGYGLAAVMVCTIAFQFLSGAAMAAILKLALVPRLNFLPSLNRTVLREMLGFGMASWVRDIIASCSYNLDCILVGAFLGPAPVAFYSVSRRLAQQAHALLANASSTLFPFSGQLFERGDRVGLRALYDHATFVIVVLASAFLVPIYMMGPDILRVWMGPEFAAQAGLVLQVLCIRFALLPMSIVNYHYMRGAGMVRTQMLIIAVNVCTTAVAMVLLIPRMGILGAAVAQLLDLPTMLFTRAYVARRLFSDMSLRATFSYLVPAVVPLAAATAVIVWAPLPQVSLVWLLVSMAGIALVSGFGAFQLGRACQRLGWMPA